MRSFFRILFKSIGWLLVLLIAAVLILSLIGIRVDLSHLRGGVEVAAGKALGRQVTIAGPVELEFSNWPALEVSDVKIANVPGAAHGRPGRILCYQSLSCTGTSVFSLRKRLPMESKPARRPGPNRLKKMRPPNRNKTRLWMKQGEITRSRKYQTDDFETTI